MLFLASLSRGYPYERGMDQRKKLRGKIPDCPYQEKPPLL
jgi:hypothetical protein